MPTALMATLLATVELAGPLRPLQHIVGSCWIAEMPGGAVDRHCFQAVYGGAHVRDTHAVSRGGRTVYAGETIYSVEGGKVTFTYWSSLGGVGRGEVEAAGGDLRFRMTMRARPDAAPEPFAVTWRMAADGYDVIDAEGTRRFRRDGDAPA